MAIAHLRLPGLHDVAECGWRLPAAPGKAAAGCALLRPAHCGGSVRLVRTWRRGELLREALLLPEDGAPPRRWPSRARALGTADQVRLLARKAVAWARHRGDADAYLAEALS